jgi:hypothetical protein
LNFADFRISVVRSGLTFFADLDVDFSAGPPATFNFDDLTFGLSAQAGVVTVDGSVFIKEFNPNTGSLSQNTPRLLGADLTFTVQF